MDLQKILDKWDIVVDVNMLYDMWNESGRYYHNINHLNSLISQIRSDYINNKFDGKIMEKLLIVALFHDIIYVPGKNDNEESSANFFINLCKDKNSKDILEIKEAIIDTKTHNSHSELSKIFNRYDMSVVEGDFDKLLEWEMGIYNEFKKFGPFYKTGRLEFLNSLLDRYPNNSINILKLIEWVKKNY